jgi:hypothetical protein
LCLALSRLYTQAQVVPPQGPLPRLGEYRKARIFRDAVADYEKEHGRGSAKQVTPGGSGTSAFQRTARPSQRSAFQAFKAFQAPRLQREAQGTRLVDGLTATNIQRHFTSFFRPSPAARTPKKAGAGAAAKTVSFRMPRRTMRL